MNKVEILDAISNMTVLELSELIKDMEEKFGVSAAASVAAVAAPAAADAVEEEKTQFDVVLTGIGDSKVSVIKAVRQITSLGLKEAKELVEGAPKSVKEAIAKSEAEEAVKILRDAGASCEIK
ncbi:MAG: 50S ribosomal protein L7/L12 [Candidatus Zeuxoniibacter abyssi]|nr:MAG: 50S ribosomal protein L7/L12 [Candidatus Persebacteraceae bacterium AB1(2)]